MTAVVDADEALLLSLLDDTAAPKPLAAEHVWHDSALIGAWSAAMSEYTVGQHGSHQHAFGHEAASLGDLLLSHAECTLARPFWPHQLFERAKRDGVDVVPLDREQQLLASPLCVAGTGNPRGKAH